MSNSTKAKTKRTKRTHLTKHQRGIMASQHFGEQQARDKVAKEE